MTSSRSRSRHQLIDSVLPALNLLRSESSTALRRQYDLDAGRRRFIRRVSGEDGSGLEQGLTLNLVSLQEVEDRLDDLIQRLESDPERFGVSVIPEGSE